MVQGVTPAHKGLAPSRLIPYLRYDKDAHAGHTQWLSFRRAEGCPQGFCLSAIFGHGKTDRLAFANPARNLSRNN